MNLRMVEGIFDYRKKREAYENGFQPVPVNWEISSPRRKDLFAKLKRFTDALN